MGTVKVSGSVNIIARHIHPTAYNDCDEWSSDIFEQRLKARLAAQKILKEEPEKARKILAVERAARCEPR